MNQKNIGELIAKLRKEKKLTQKQLGEKLCVDGKAVSKWECGITTPDISIINNLSSILGITSTELLNGKLNNDLNSKKNNQNIKYFLRQNVLWISSVIILSIISIILLLYFINNYKKYQLINFSLNENNILLSGYISVYPNRKIINLNDIVYNFEDNGTLNELKINNLKLIILNDEEIIFEHVFDNEYDNNGNIKSYYINEMLDNFKGTTTTSFSKNKITKLKVLIEYETQDEIQKNEYPLRMSIVEISSKIF